MPVEQCILSKAYPESFLSINSIMKKITDNVPQCAYNADGASDNENHLYSCILYWTANIANQHFSVITKVLLILAKLYRTKIAGAAKPIKLCFERISNFQISIYVIS